MSLENKKTKLEKDIKDITKLISDAQMELDSIALVRSNLLIDIANSTGNEQGKFQADLIELDVDQMNKLKIMSSAKNAKIKMGIELAQINFQIIREPLEDRFKDLVKNNANIMYIYPATRNWKLKMLEILKLEDNALFLIEIEKLETAELELHLDRSGKVDIRDSVISKLEGLGLTADEIKLLI